MVQILDEFGNFKTKNFEKMKRVMDVEADVPAAAPDPDPEAAADRVFGDAAASGGRGRGKVGWPLLGGVWVWVVLGGWVLMWVC